MQALSLSSAERIIIFWEINGQNWSLTASEDYQIYAMPSHTFSHCRTFLLPACIVLWTDVITGIPLAVVAKLRARHLFPTSSLSKNKWNSFCYDLHVWFAFHSYFNKQNCSNLCQWKENLTQQGQRGQRQRWSWFQVFAQEKGFKVPLPQTACNSKVFYQSV